MKRIICLIVFCLFGCDLGPTDPIPEPTIIKPIPIAEPESYCGDGVCDENIDEDAWWCVDCGYNPFTGGPKNGGFCGDSICFGQEDILTCCSDCCPIPYLHIRIGDPSWIDPI